jgi:hypothetical protein
VPARRQETASSTPSAPPGTRAPDTLRHAAPGLQ